MGIFAKKGKYSSIKDEVTNNKIYCITMDLFENAYNKAKRLLNQSPNIKQLSCCHGGSYSYKIKENSPPTIAHILAVILYTDYGILSYRFSQSFRKISENESDRYTKKRGNEFWNWKKTLIETVN